MEVKEFLVAVKEIKTSYLRHYMTRTRYEFVVFIIEDKIKDVKISDILLIVLMGYHPKSSFLDI